MRKTMFSALLVFAMLFSFVGFGVRDVRAETLEFSNVKISDDGIMTWDPLKGIGKYEIHLEREHNVLLYFSERTGSNTTSFDINEYLERIKAYDDLYYVTLTARDASGNLYEWKGLYQFSNPNKRLPVPANARLEGDQLVWDYDFSVLPKENIIFCLDIVARDDEGNYVAARECFTREPKMDFPGLYKGTYDYRILIWAESVNKPNPQSDECYVNFEDVPSTGPQITGLKYKDGILSWDHVPGATRYSVTATSYDGFGYHDEEFVTRGTAIDLSEEFGSDHYEMGIRIYAEHNEGDDVVYNISTLGEYSFKYTYDGYPLIYRGRRVNNNWYLDDICGDGGSVKYIPTENRLVINNPHFIVTDNTDKSSPIIQSSGTLTVEGNCNIKYPAAFIEAEDLIIDSDSSLTIESDTYAISADNIIVMDGVTMDLKGKGDYILRANEYMLFNELVDRVSVESLDKGSAIGCGLGGERGVILMYDYTHILIPKNGKLNDDETEIVTKDNKKASKVWMSFADALPTPVPTATPTAKPTTKPDAKPTAQPSVKPTIKPAASSTTTPTPTPVPVEKKSQILSFVERLYSCVLNREPEAEGAAYWSDELYGFRRTGAEVAQGFIFSEEFENRKTSNEQFVTILYNTFFNRAPDEAGMNYWLEQLSSGAMDRTAVANGFIYSQEWADTCASYGIRSGGELKPTGNIAPTDLTYAFVERMYTTAMGRAYDEEGRQYWASELANFNVTGEYVGAAFFLSGEMNGYGLSNEEYLVRLYATFMNREPDPDGKAYWLGVMEGGMQRSDVVFGFTRSSEFTEKCVEARILPYS